MVLVIGLPNRLSKAGSVSQIIYFNTNNQLKNLYLSSLIAALLFAGCTTSSIISNKSPNFTDKLEKVFVVMEGNENGTLYILAICRHLNKQFVPKGVEFKYHIMDNLALETEKQLAEKINQFQPQYVMLIKQSETLLTQRNYINHYQNLPTWGKPALTSIAFDVQLRSYNGEEMLWRASLRTDNISELEDSTEKTALTLIQKMQTDGLLK